MEYRIDLIKVSTNRRPLGDISGLKTSIETIGLLNPITIRNDGRLVAGLHRLEACKELGWERIPVTFLDADELHAELAEIDENLLRNELHWTEHDKQVARRKEIYEELFPQTAIAGRGKNQHMPSEIISLGMIPSFTEDTADKTGESRRNVELAVQRANAFDDDDLDVLRTAEIPKTEATKIARMPEQERKEYIAHIANTDTAKPHVTHNSGNNEWYTPKEYIEAARKVMGCIDLDPASCDTANTVVQATEYYTIDRSGLDVEWQGRVWMNPPYASGLIDKFAEKMAHHSQAGDIHEAVILVNNATETGWFRRIASVASAVVFPGSRVKFWSPIGVQAAPLQGQAILYIGENSDVFLDAFCGFGWGANIR